MEKECGEEEVQTQIIKQEELVDKLAGKLVGGGLDEELDEFGLFEVMRGLLFDEVTFAHGKPGGVYRYLWPPATKGQGVNLLQPDILLKLPSTNTSLFAHYVWNASIILSDFIAENKLPLEKDKKLMEKGVVELGAGTALPSIVLLSLLSPPSSSSLPPSFSSLSTPSSPPPKIIITDYDDPSLINTIYTNLINNLSPSIFPSCKLIGHTWATSAEPILHLLNPSSPPSSSSSELQKCGIIMMADTIWEQLNHASLIISCHELLAEDGVIYLSFCNHSGGDQPDQFFSAAKSPPFYFTFELLFTIPLSLADNPTNVSSTRDYLHRFNHIYRGVRSPPNSS